jgi:four helix bundle protein
VDLISSALADFICIADFILAKARISLYNAIEVIAMAENKLADLSTDFAVRILKLTDGIKGHYSLVNQLERSATSIGANIREAKYAHSKADFVSKLQIALKESYETEYWLELMQKADLLPEEMLKIYLHDCGSIRRMLIASINTTKAKQ